MGVSSHDQSKISETFSVDNGSSIQNTITNMKLGAHQSEGGILKTFKNKRISMEG